MRLALLTGLAAAALVAGAAGARAETIYITEPYVQTAPRYVYTVPTPIPGPGYVAIDPGYTVMAAPPPAFALAPPPSPFFSPPPAQVVVAPPPAQVVVAPPPAQVVVAPRPARVVVAPRTNRVAVAPARARIVVAPALAPARVVVQAPEIVDPPMVIAPRDGIVTTGFSPDRRCFIDFRGMERCY
jgi:hypothetical protein